MDNRYAILVDGAFLCKRLRAKLKRTATPQDVVGECARIKGHPDLVDRPLLRVYFYDAPPATGTLTNPFSKKSMNLGRTPVHAAQTAFHDALELMPDVAFRRGETSLRWWKIKEHALKDIARTGRAVAATDLAPNIEQKGVDLRIGLDIARLSLQHLVETIVVVTGDSDIVPAFKFARREGVRVYLDHMGSSVKRELKAHVDMVL